MKSGKHSNLSLVFQCLVLLASCTDNQHDCRFLANCPETSGGTTSDSGAGGSTNAGGTTHAGGDATGGITSACNAACSGDTPVCDEAAKVCVGCLSDSQCSGAKPACRTDESTDSGTGAGAGTNICVECTSNEHCGGAATLCDTAANVCVECLTNDDCPEPSASLCLAGICSSCTANADCSHIAGKTVCDATRSSASEVDAGANGDAGTSTNTCVQCTGTDYAACGQSNGKNLVCDSLSNTCSTQAQASAGLCQTCVSDAQCQDGEMCVQELFNGSSVGYFCFYKQGAVGAPAVCGNPSRPYSGLVKNASSIDGQVADICSLRSTTCTALNEFSSKDCTAAGVADDQLCGFASGVDSKCVAFTSPEYVCTVTCLSDYDCRAGVSCLTGNNPPVCSLQ